MPTQFDTEEMQMTTTQERPTGALHKVRADAVAVFGSYPTLEQRRAWLLEFAETVATEGGHPQSPNTQMIPLLVPIAAGANCVDVAGCFNELVDAVEVRRRFDSDPNEWLARHDLPQSDRCWQTADEQTQTAVDEALDALMGRQS